MKNCLKIAFFTESGTKRGMGHLIRTYSIYQKFNKEYEAKFYLDSDIDFTYKFKDIINFKWQEFKLEDKFDIIFIDSYIAEKKIYEKISKSCKLSVYLDDYERLSYPNGMVINFAPDAQKLFFKNKKENMLYLLGIKYIPLREDFKNTIAIKKKQIFISFGGSTKDEIYIKIIEAINEININKVVITTSRNLSKKLEKYKGVRVLYKPNDSILLNEMSKSYISITTASMLVYELSYFKVINIIIALSMNQEIGLSQFLDNNFAYSSISFSDIKWEKKLKKVLLILIKNENTIKINTEIDNNGINRIYNKVLEEIKE